MRLGGVDVEQVRPHGGRDGRFRGSVVPHSEGFAHPRLVRRQVLTQPQQRPLRRPMRERRIRLRPLAPVVGVALLVRRTLDVHAVDHLAGQRLVPTGCERLARVDRPGRRAHEEQQGPMRVAGLVRCRHHVLERSFRQDLCLVEHDDVDLVEPTPEPGLPGPEHDVRPVAERDLLLPVRRPNPHPVPPARLDVRGDRLAFRVPLQRSERVRRRPRPVRRPQHLQARELGRQTEHGPTHEERLRHLPGDRQRDPANRRRVLPGLPPAQHDLAETALPLVELVAPLRTLRLDLRPTRRHDPLGDHEMAGDLR